MTLRIYPHMKPIYALNATPIMHIAVHRRFFQENSQTATLDMSQTRQLTSMLIIMHFFLYLNPSGVSVGQRALPVCERRGGDVYAGPPDEPPRGTALQG